MALSEAIPTTFAESVSHVIRFVFDVFDREIATKQLRYHNHEHVNGVENRATRIFQTVRPYWAASDEYLDRMQLLINLCAIAHDMIQIFAPQTEPYTSRRRETGISERATLEQLLNYIASLNAQIQSVSPNSPALFTDEDQQIIEQAILATICAYNPDEQAIYQPSLSQHHLSCVARIIALADIGALAIDGIQAYNREGSLLFLEENPDILSLIETGKISTLQTDVSELYENVRQRLLRRTQFQVSFARSRLSRLPQELVGLPIDAIPSLMQNVFQFATDSTLETIIETTPIAAETSLETLLKFFQFESSCGTIAR